ncbi:ribosomal protein S5 domain 2-type protein [Protomyces lactucae-debilis]|uniref:Ribosomal protein S5 domain 2-type protein n=1 Tax=Protomyces lactucae-debilis TaxID=2754530 RepID=A0A1Y2FU96_PROLT|nr:ribosomal protein S5 domain 2-type protein [Protomyces lactucae-debilis]ORY87583.1 ribosomal protein S5 domain 2-type protein [Protomyces lactucae-debilis]
MAMPDPSALEDEVLAIQSIYPGYLEQSSGTESTYKLKVHAVELYLNFPDAYPAIPPKVSSVTGIARERIEQHLHAYSGEEILFSLISMLSDEKDDEEEEQAMVEIPPTAQALKWTIGEPVHDRKSTMLGRAIQIHNKEELMAALEDIKNDKHLQKASHPQIWACRYRHDKIDGPERIIAEHDDDGETGAGPRLAFLLEVTKATNVLVVVTRWFGGVLLGDVRFKHISTAARDALDKGGFLT